MESVNEESVGGHRESWIVRSCSARTTRISFVALILITACRVDGAIAQTAPEIDYVFPAGARRGTSVEVQVGAEFVPGASRLDIAGSGLSVKPLDKAGRYRIDVAADAPLGPAELRMVVTQGASAPFPFIVGEMPEVSRSDHRPISLKPPIVVNARLEAAGVVDEYLLDLAAGQRIVCAASTQALRSPVDPMLRLLDSQGRKVAEGFDHRSADELLVFHASKAGRFVLQVFDFQLVGGSRNVYRLTVTDGPWLDYAYPLGARQGTTANLVLHGWNLNSQGSTTLDHRLPPQPAGRSVVELPHGGNRLTIPIGPDVELAETEPNDDREQARELALPCTVSGRLQTPGDCDVYSVMLDKGAKLAVDLESAGLGFPTDPMLTLSDAEGKVLQEVDDYQALRDPKLRYAAVAAGRYFLTIRDRAADGGDDFVYRLRVSEPRPDITARANTTNLMLHNGRTTNLPVLVDRLDGFGDECEVTALDLPAGVSAEAQLVPAKTPATLQLPIVVKEGTAPIGGRVRIVVRSKKADEPWQRAAMIAEAPSSTSGSSTLWVAVSPEIPFKLQTTSTILDAPRLAAFPFPVEVKRDEGFSGPIRLVGVRPDQRGTVKPLTGTIAAASSTGTLPLVVQNQVIEGTTHRCRVMGVADVQGIDGKTYTVGHVAAGSMSVGCQPSLLTLTVAPAIVAWRPGERHELRVQVNRRTAMQPVLLKAEFESAATGATCAPIVVPEGSSEAVLSLHFAPDAKLPPRTVLTIQAESSFADLPIYGRHSLRLETR
jgi:hypothetical protein